MEDDRHGRRHQWKRTLMEDDINGKIPQWKMTSMEDDLNGRQRQWKTTSIEDNLIGTLPHWKMTIMEDNLIGRNLDGRQPQLLWFIFEHYNYTGSALINLKFVINFHPKYARGGKKFHCLLTSRKTWSCFPSGQEKSWPAIFLIATVHCWSAL